MCSLTRVTPTEHLVLSPFFCINRITDITNIIPMAWANLIAAFYQAYHRHFHINIHRALHVETCPRGLLDLYVPRTSVILLSKTPGCLSK